MNARITFQEKNCIEKLKRRGQNEDYLPLPWYFPISTSPPDSLREEKQETLKIELAQELEWEKQSGRHLCDSGSVCVPEQDSLCGYSKAQSNGVSLAIKAKCRWGAIG
jgi:hypothetical protein